MVDLRRARATAAASEEHDVAGLERAPRRAGRCRDGPAPSRASCVRRARSRRRRARRSRGPSSRTRRRRPTPRPRRTARRSAATARRSAPTTGAGHGRDRQRRELGAHVRLLPALLAEHLPGRVGAVGPRRRAATGSAPRHRARSDSCDADRGCARRPRGRHPGCGSRPASTQAARDVGRHVSQAERLDERGVDLADGQRSLAEHDRARPGDRREHPIEQVGREGLLRVERVGIVDPREHAVADQERHLTARIAHERMGARGCRRCERGRGGRETDQGAVSAHGEPGVRERGPGTLLEPVYRRRRRAARAGGIRSRSRSRSCPRAARAPPGGCARRPARRPGRPRRPSSTSSSTTKLRASIETVATTRRRRPRTSTSDLPGERSRVAVGVADRHGRDPGRRLGDEAPAVARPLTAARASAEQRPRSSRGAQAGGRRPTRRRRPGATP